MTQERIIAVQTILAGGDEAELRFHAVEMRQESGSLLLLSRSAEGGELTLTMAFAPSCWRGAWVVDPATQRPAGLDPASAPSALNSFKGRPAAPAVSPADPEPWPASYQGAPASPPVPTPAAPAAMAPAPAAPAPAPPPPAPTPAPAPLAPAPAPIPEAPVTPEEMASEAAPLPVATAAEPTQALPPEAEVEVEQAGATSAWDSMEKEARADFIAQALAQRVYAGVEALATELNLPPAEVEVALSNALGLRKTPIQAVRDPEMQDKMDVAVHEIIKEHRPKRPSEILERLIEREDTRLADVIQLRVWLLQNPPKRPA